MATKYTKVNLRNVQLAVICALLLVFSTVKAQRDIIKTKAGEDIRCRIIDETPVRFVFAYLKNGKPFKSEIFKNLVTDFKFNYFDSDLPGADKLPKPLNRELGEGEAKTSRMLTQNESSGAKRSKKEKGNEVVAVDKSVAKREMPISAQQPYENKEYRSNNPRETELPRLSREQEINLQKAATNQAQTTSKDLSDVAKKDKSAEESSKSKSTNRNEPIAITPSPAKTPVKSTAVTPVKKPEVVTAIETKEIVASSEREATSAAQIQKQQQTVTQNTTAPQSAVDVPVTTFEKVLAPPVTPAANLTRPYKWRIGIKGGIGNRLDNNLVTTNAYDLYLEQLLRGFTVGADIAYFPGNTVGFGAIYTDFRSRNREDNLTYRNIFTNTELIGNVSNNRSVKFVGPALFLRKKLDFKTYIVLGLSPGYNFYSDKGKYDLENYTVKGNGFGGVGTLGIDFLLGNEINGRDIILSFEAGYSYGKITQLDYGDSRGLVTTANPIDVSRLDFTVGLRFLGWPRVSKR